MNLWYFFLQIYYIYTNLCITTLLEAYMRKTYSILFILSFSAIGFSQNVTVGEIAPAFSLSAFGGGTLSLDDHAGKVRFLNFFGSTWSSCLSEAQRIETNIWLAFKDQGLQVLGLDVWNGSISNVQNFALGGGRNITYPLGTMAFIRWSDVWTRSP